MFRRPTCQDGHALASHAVKGKATGHCLGKGPLTIVSSSPDGFSAAGGHSIEIVSDQLSLASLG